MMIYLLIAAIFSSTVCFSDQVKSKIVDAHERKISQEVDWKSFEYFFDEKSYTTGVKFFNSQKKLIGVYTDPENLKMLTSEEDLKEIGESYKIVETSNKKKLLISIWMSGQYHRYRIFNPNVSINTPVCDLQGEGDYPEKINFQLHNDVIKVQVQEKLGKLTYLDCKYTSVHKHKN